MQEYILQPFAQSWTIPILKCVHSLNEECRNASTFKTPFNCVLWIKVCTVLCLIPIVNMITYPAIEFE